MTLIPNTVISLAKKAKFYNDKYKSYFDFVVNENDTRPSFSTFNDFNGAFLAYFLTISKNTETTHLWNDIKSLKNFKLPETYKGDVYNHIIANIAHTFNYSINLPTYEINKKETKKASDMCLLLSEYLMSNNKMLSENIGFEISDVSNYIHDIKEMSQYFEFFDSEESGVFTGSYFRFLLSEGFPSIGLLIFQLHIYLDEIIHQKSYMKQPNSKHVSLHVFCRLLKKRFVSTYKKPNYKIIARIASILFEHLDGLTISEDYVKQLCRAKTKRNNISKPISQSKFLELLAKKSSKSEKNTK